MTNNLVVIRHQIFKSVLVVLACYIVISVLYVSPKSQNKAHHDLMSSTNKVLQVKDFPTDFDGLPKDVYYFWCENNTMFEFRHYLSVRSVFLHLNPFRVRLLHEYDPVTHELGHNTWLAELRHDNAYFSTDKLPQKWCADKQRNIDEYLSKYGGIYVHENVILAGPLDKEWFKIFDSVKVIGDDTKDKLLQISRRKSSITGVHTTKLNTTSSAAMSMKFINGEASLEDSRNKTGTVETISSRPTITPQPLDNTVLLFKAVAPVVPEQIWELDSAAANSCVWKTRFSTTRSGFQ